MDLLFIMHLGVIIHLSRHSASSISCFFTESLIKHWHQISYPESKAKQASEIIPPYFGVDLLLSERHFYD